MLPAIPRALAAGRHGHYRVALRRVIATYCHGSMIVVSRERNTWLPESKAAGHSTPMYRDAPTAPWPRQTDLDELIAIAKPSLEHEVAPPTLRSVCNVGALPITMSQCNNDNTYIGIWSRLYGRFPSALNTWSKVWPWILVIWNSAPIFGQQISILDHPLTVDFSVRLGLNFHPMGEQGGWASDTFLPRDAMLSAVYAVVVCLCVCVSVTLRYCIKTAKRRITQTTPHDSPMTLVFWCQRSWRNSKGITPYGGDKCRWGGLKFVTFDENRAITRKRYKIDI